MKKELGKWLMDIAKFLTTAILLSSTFSNIESLVTIFVCVFVIACTLVVGMLLVEEPKVRVSRKLNKKK